MDLTKFTTAQKKAVWDKFDEIAGGKFTALNYFIFNSTMPLKSTRVIIEAPAIIDNQTVVKNAVTAGKIWKIIASSQTVVGDKKYTTQYRLFDYLHSPTSWYWIYTSTK